MKMATKNPPARRGPKPKEPGMTVLVMLDLPPEAARTVRAECGVLAIDPPEYVRRVFRAWVRTFF